MLQGKIPAVIRNSSPLLADEFLPAAVNLATCDNVIMLMFKIKRERGFSLSII